MTAARARIRPSFPMKDAGEKALRYEQFLNDHFLNIETTRYNARIHASSLLWAINDMAANGPSMYPEFGKVIEGHFAQKKERIASVLRKWESQDRILPKRHELLVAGISQFAKTMKLDALARSQAVSHDAEEKESKESKESKGASEVHTTKCLHGAASQAAGQKEEKVLAKSSVSYSHLFPLESEEGSEINI